MDPSEHRIAIVYDCLYPATVGGAERWYRRLADSLAEDGFDVTYVTRQQWRRGSRPRTRFTLSVVSPGRSLYRRDGKRRLLTAVLFGIGVFWHMLLRGGRYDVVDVGNFPYFSVIGAWLGLRMHRNTSLVCDWFECWSRELYVEYFGQPGRIAYRIQRLCLRLPDASTTFSAFVAQRLHEEDLRGGIVRLPGLYDGSGGSATADQDTAHPAGDPPTVLFAGRHIPEKRVMSLPAAYGNARTRVPDLRLTVLGDGPDRREVERRVAALGLDDVVDISGFVSQERVEREMRSATCLVLPSSREGYGLVVVEATSHGTPVVVVAGPDNAATELVLDGVNGYVSPSADPDDLGRTIVRTVEAGAELRQSTARWFADNRERLSMDNSIDRFRRLVDEVTS